MQIESAAQTPLAGKGWGALPKRASVRAGGADLGAYTFRLSQVWETMPKMARSSLQIGSSAYGSGFQPPILRTPIAAFPGALPQADIGWAFGPLTEFVDRSSSRAIRRERRRREPCQPGAKPQEQGDAWKRRVECPYHSSLNAQTPASAPVARTHTTRGLTVSLLLGTCVLCRRDAANDRG